MSVNLSARQLQEPGLVEEVAEELARAELDPATLTLEITESVLMGDDAARGKLDQLRSLGVRIAVDDFGTGYSSLGYLGRFPIDILKVDRSFVRNVARGGEDAALAAAVLRLASTFRKLSVAEGIENKAQAAALAALGCELGQGFLFARPLPEADLDRYLELHRPQVAGLPGASPA